MDVVKGIGMFERMRGVMRWEVESALLRNWHGPGIVECRDVGPYRCLITFESREIRDEAMNNEILTSMFDEVRHHWRLIWSLSRRVWVEVIGLPTLVWSMETFEKIAGLWGKFVLADDRTEHSMSFTVARFMIDSFEWEKINEWVRVKIYGKVVDVFVKEFGYEVYSRMAHPNEEEMKKKCSSGGEWLSEERTEDVPMKVKKSIPVKGTDGNLITNGTSDGALHEKSANNINEGVDVGGVGMRFTRSDEETRGHKEVDGSLGDLTRLVEKWRSVGWKLEWREVWTVWTVLGQS
ncbi:hypothetical protein PIB30_055337 [Stylosanthes scabra]|uniref:DUF4283 domain-containing protein n=1 Tax=Stylosanthes scabra TaxID=79078 RepID=A0ABU6UI32_9FABA|nr:hypothetical protein [Stylosanthes scabra]